MSTLLITLLFGIILGLTLTLFSFWLLKVKCPGCKQLKPVPEVIHWHWKTRTITGKLCQQCQKPKPQIDIQL